MNRVIHTCRKLEKWNAQEGKAEERKQKNTTHERYFCVVITYMYIIFEILYC